MSSSERIPVLAILDTSDDIADLLMAVFQMEGFRTVPGFTRDLKRGTVDFATFVTTHQPDVIIWDIAIPYEENWAFFQAVAASPTGRHCRFVLTTTNKHALQQLVGEVPAHELVGKPYDLQVLIRAVRAARDQPLDAER